MQIRLTRIKNAVKSLTLTQSSWLLFAFVVLFNEWFIYYLIPITWPAVKPHDSRVKQLRVMFVSDPQLIGYTNDPKYIRFLAIWDSDRYLYKGFWSAFNYIRPEVVIFLGDLFDEGSWGPWDVYKTTHDRFRYIFDLQSTVQGIYLPGDNDIGGETDLKSDWKRERFEHFFHKEPPVNRIKFVDFIPVGLDFNEYVSDEVKAKLQEAEKQSTAPLRIILNHHGLLERNTHDIQKIVTILRPHFFITSHYHKQMFVNLTDGVRPKPKNFQWTNQNHFNFKLFEMRNRIQLAVPSCSYRMGFPDDVGYSAAVIDSTGNLDYTMLWLPNRHKQLYCYLGFGVIALIVSVLSKCYRRYHVGR